MPITGARLARRPRSFHGRFHATATDPERIGLGGLTEAEWIARFGRFDPLPGRFPRALALRQPWPPFRSSNSALSATGVGACGTQISAAA